MRRVLAILTFLAIAVRPLGPAAQPAPAIAPLRTATAADLAAGKRIFDAQCAWCHGTGGAGGTGPTLQRANLRNVSDDATLVRVVRTGIPGTEMPTFVYSITPRMAWQTAAYVRSLGRTAPHQVHGNSDRGKALYEKHQCAACHTVGGTGGVVGPDLTAIGALRGPTHLRQS